MLHAAVVGLGWWGGTLVEAVQGGGLIGFTAAATRKRSDKDRAFAEAHGLRLASYEEILADPSIDAVVLATPPMGHRDQILAAARAGKHVFCE
jgi:predicted dehydrogenase